MTRKQQSAVLRLILNIYLLIAFVSDFILVVPLTIRFYAIIAFLIVNLFEPFFHKVFKVDLSFYILTLDLVFAVVGTYTGNRFDLYNRLFFYDIMLHFVSGILIALTFYDVVFRSKLPQVPLGHAIFLTALAGIAGAAIWEICEFMLDIVTHSDVQRNNLPEWEIFGKEWQNPGIRDTMNDMINGTAGALVGSLTIFIKSKLSKSHLPND